MAEELTAAPLVPRAERAVDFYGDTIPVAIVGDEAYVPLRQITDFLGLNWSGQYLRVQRNEILARHVRKVDVLSCVKPPISCSLAVISGTPTL